MERLSAQDLMGLFDVEDRGWPQDIGALAVLDGRRLLDPDGGFRIDQVRAHIERRLHLAPHFRQIVHMPGWGRGWPLWVDATSLDLSHHVRQLAVEPPGGEPELMRAWERVRRQPFDRARPLWQMWFLTGLPDGRIGFFMKVSHAIADGMAGVAALGAFVDVTPDVPEATSPTWTPDAMPSGRELLADNVRRHLEALDRATDRLAHPAELARAARRAWPAVHEAFFDGRAPSTSLNARPVSPERRLVTIGGSLDLTKRIARAHEAKVNDVVLATIAGGFRDLLLARGEPVDGVLLRAMVPVSLHDGTANARGNRDGAMVVPLPVGEAGAAERLSLIAAATAERKKKARPPGGTLFRNRLIQRAFLGITSHQRFFNTYVTNVPGPPVPLFFAGAQILEIFPLVPLIGNLSIGIGALSYTGQFNVTVVADRDLCPDLETFAAGIRGSLTALERSIRAPSRILV